MKKIILMLICTAMSVFVSAQTSSVTNPADSTTTLMGDHSLAPIWKIKDTVEWNIYSNKVRLSTLKTPLSTDTGFDNIVVSDSIGNIKSIPLASTQRVKDINDSVAARYTSSQVDNLFTYWLSQYYPINNPEGYLKFAEWTEIHHLPTEFTPIPHMHDIPEIGCLQDSLANRYTKSETNDLLYNTFVSYSPTLAVSGNEIYCINGNSITIPTQTVPIVINSAGATTVTGSHPNFTINTPVVTNVDLSGSAQTVNRRAQGVITPSVANSYTLDISSLGFTNIINVQCTAVRNSTTDIEIPYASIKSVSTTQIVINFIEGKAVLPSDVTLTFASTSGLSAYILIEGN